jgi:murein DD-endopeptidase MepM/ murein hydrolase activator NlpD
MRPPTHFNVVVVRADGRGVRHLHVPRWTTRAAAGIVVAAALANVALLADYARVRRDHGSIAATRADVDARARALEPLERRLAELRAEVVGWDALHAAIAKPLGGASTASGVGGPALPVAGRSDAPKPVDDVDALVALIRAEGQRLRALAGVARETGAVLAALPSKMPVRGKVNSGFGTRPSPWTGASEFHAGVDLAAAPGTPVAAAAPGTVRFAGSAAGYGTSVVLDHGRGIESRYGHLQRASVTRGQRVERGQTIGLSGNTGRSTAPHLHYEVLVDGRAVDPRRLARD